MFVGPLAVSPSGIPMANKCCYYFDSYLRPSAMGWRLISLLFFPYADIGQH